MPYLQKHADGITFKLRVQPRSKKNSPAGLYGDALKIKLTAPPVDGAANRACLKYLAGLLDVPPSALEIASGTSGRDKMIRVKLATSTEIAAVIGRINRLAKSNQGKA